MTTIYDEIAAIFDPSPEDWVAARVHRLFAFDPKLAQFFQGRIYLLHGIEEIDYTVREGPILRIAPHLSGEPVSIPGQVEERRVEVAVSLQWEEVKAEPVYGGVPPSEDRTIPGVGFGTVLDYCWKRINTKENRALWELNLQTGEQVQLVSPGLTNRGVEDLTPDRASDTGPWTFGMVLILQFTVRVDVRSGKIENLR